MLDDMKIGTRLIVAFGFELISTNAMLVAAIYCMSKVQGNFDHTAKINNIQKQLTYINALKMYDSALWLLMTGTLTVIVIALVVMLFITRSIVRPLIQGVGVVRALEDGNLNKDLESIGDNEISKLLSGMQNMATKLRTVIGNVKISADNVTTGSRQLMATSDDISKDSQDLSLQIDQIVSAMTELSQTVVEVAKNASLAADASKEASETAMNGKKMVDITAADMAQIALTIEQAAVIVEDLGKSSAMIGDMVAVVYDIADQTNLLALNAAIEAARAGEQGRGFAVVADEVKKLAERTSKATKDISQRVSGIQHAAEESVKAIKRGSREVEKGVALAREASSSLDSIVEVSAVAMDMVHLIATATEQQSAATEEVTRNMENISAITKKTAEAAQHIGTSATDLSDLTVGLKEIIAFFKGTPAEAETLVKKTISYIKKHGREKGFTELSNPNGDFVNRDLYVFVHDLSGTCIAHGRDTKKIGKSEINFKDANNVFCVRDRIEIARTKGHGWQQYQNINPVTKQIEDKIAYIEKYDDFMVGSGAYK